MLKNKKVILILLVLGSFGVLFLAIFTFNKEGATKEKDQTTLLPTEEKVPPEFKGLKPGEATVDDVVSELGRPVSQETNGTQTTATFQSESPVVPHKVVFEEEKAVYLKQIIIRTDVTPVNIKSIYGPEPIQLYGPDQNAGLFLYVYPDKGIAYIGSEDSETLLEVWYFEPLENIQEFIQKWAPNYSTTRENVGHF